MISRGLLFARTARHLRWEQWVYRPVRALQRRVGLVPPAVRLKHSPARWRALAESVTGWGPGDPAARLERATEVAEGRFTFLNHAELLPSIDWNRRYVSHLWSYNLHYFDYAVDLAWAFRASGETRFAECYVELATGWAAATRPGRGDGWEPYALSLRVVNWIYALLLFGDAIPPSAHARLRDSLGAQLAFLEARLELHILANHLLKNLKALAVAGSAFDGDAAVRWRERTAERLWDEIDEQVLPDGVHFERSPMYHAISLGDLLEVLSLRGAAGDPIPEETRDHARRMVASLAVLSRPDGSLHLFNDSAQGIAPDRSWLDALARSVLGAGIPEPCGSVELASAGYYGFIDPIAGERLLVDCGEPGPCYQPGHAHCDLLSFELDLAGRPVVVDSGVSGYDGDGLREYVRSTRAHNTVLIANSEQSEVWGTFRLARRARPGYALQTVPLAGYRFEGACSPYQSSAAIHARVLERVSGIWTVRDVVEGAADRSVGSFLHFHPDFQLEQGEGEISLRGGSLRVIVRPFGFDRILFQRGEDTPPQGWYCPEFGSAHPALAVGMHIDRYDGRPFGYSIRHELLS